MPTHAVTLVTPDGPSVIDCPSDDFVLHAALERGIELPYLCLLGWCTTCAAKVLEGELDHSASWRYFAEDRAAGFALLCTARPLSDVKVLTHQRDAMRAHRVALGLPVPRG